MFIDPSLAVCNKPSNNELFNYFSGGPIYVWNIGGNPNYYFCEHMNECFCPACSKLQCFCFNFIYNDEFTEADDDESSSGKF